MSRWLAALWLVLVMSEATGCRKPNADLSDGERSTNGSAPSLPSAGTHVTAARCGTEPCALLGARSFAIAGTRIFALNDAQGLLELPLEGDAAIVLAPVTGKSLVADDEAVYVASRGALGQPRSAMLRRVERRDGSTKRIAEHIDEPWQMAADASHVYWKSGTLGHEAIWRVPKAGGTVEAVVEQTGLASFGVVDGAVFFSENVTDSLWRVAPGGAPNKVAKVGKVSIIALVAGDIYMGRPSWTSEVLRLKPKEREARLVAKLDCLLSELTPGNGEVLATCRSAGRVIAVPTSVGDPKGVLKNVDGLSELAVAGPWLFWQRDGHLFRMKR